MQQVDVERSQEFRKCIECFLCQDVCHVIRDHEDNKPAFAGPRFFIRLAELDMHPLDTLDRSDEAQEEHGLGMCNITKCCTEVCPEHIKITDNAIIPLKERVVDRKYDPLSAGSAARSADVLRRTRGCLAPGTQRLARQLGDLPAGGGKRTGTRKGGGGPTFHRRNQRRGGGADPPEKKDHHPDIDIRWRKVLFTVSTHSAGGVTQLDIELAHRISSAAADHGAT